MVSVLIPTYNYDVTNLVKVIHSQASNSGILYEVLVYDDGSKSKLNEQNKTINSLEHCTFKELDKNIGRSAIRNQLGADAKYDYLLFLDADVKIFTDDFLSKYLDAIQPETQIIYGGICYQKETPNKEAFLRWIYGNKREALSVQKRMENPHLSFLTLNFVIKKSVFSTMRFDETIPNFRNEDLLFAIAAREKNIRIQHIDNTVEHLGIESSQKFLEKTHETVQSFDYITSKGLMNPNDAALTRVGFKLDTWKLSYLYKAFYRISKSVLKRNLLSKHPSLFLFDLYRLGYFLEIKSKP
ncbi:MAG: glycosyltransferase [Gelidibacter sp.]